MPRRRTACACVALLLAGCTPVLPPSPPRASAWGEPAPTPGSTPPLSHPSITAMCRDVFAAQLADLDDPDRIHVDSPTPACAPVLRELARHPGIARWHRSERRARAARCPGPHCGPARGVLVTVAHDHGHCFHASVRMGTGGSFSTQCWEHGTIVARGPIGLW